MSYLEPVYLNEKMLLNCAAYVLKGVSLETEVSSSSSNQKKANVALGFKFLTELISPISAGAEIDHLSGTTSKTARRYTLGGLHMTLVDSLTDDGRLKVFNVHKQTLDADFVQLDVMLRPIDIFAIIEALKISTPLIAQFLQNFGEKINPRIFDKAFLKELGKYESLLATLLSKLEEDYLTSGLLEMVMIDPETGAKIGIVDVDVADLNANSIKSKLTDGRFKIIGKVSRSVSGEQSMSLVQRTILSSVMEIVDKVATVGGQADQYSDGIRGARAVVEKVCQLSLPGPAVRVMAMSICL